MDKRMEKPVPVSDYFFSNCLFEAVKAKLRNWKKTRLIFIPRKYNMGHHGHFIWKDLETNDYFEFVSKDGRDRFLLAAIFNQGHIIRTPWERHNRFVQIGVQRKVLAFERSLGKKMDFVSMNVENQKIIDKYRWRGFEFPDEDGFIVCLINDMPKLFQVKGLQIVDLDGSKTVDWDDIPLTNWKYI